MFSMSDCKSGKKPNISSISLIELIGYKLIGGTIYFHLHNCGNPFTAASRYMYMYMST